MPDPETFLQNEKSNARERILMGGVSTGQHVVEPHSLPLHLVLIYAKLKIFKGLLAP